DSPLLRTLRLTAFRNSASKLIAFHRVRMTVALRKAVAFPQDVCASFMEKVRHARARALLLDYDGTLAPFTPDRSRAFPYREIPELISRIMRCNTRVVLVSGRPATELVFLSGIHPHPEIWGSHGSERLRPDGSYEVEAPPPE